MYKPENVCFCRSFVNFSQVRYEHSYHIKASFVYWAKEVFVDKSGIIDYDIPYCLAKEGAVMNKKFTRIVCIVLASVLVLSLVAMVIPMLVA